MSNDNMAGLMDTKIEDKVLQEVADDKAKTDDVLQQVAVSAPSGRFVETVPDDVPEATRNIRQKDLVPQEILDQYTVVIVGCGAVGHQVGRMLAALGATDAIVCDHDAVAIENMSAQGFCPGEIGEYKACVVAVEMQDMHPDMVIGAMPEKFSDAVRNMIDKERKIAVFSCVDRMDVREQIHTCFAERAEIFIDTRMGAETGRVIAVTKDNYAEYKKTIHSDGETYEAPCTAKSTSYCANFIAAIAVSTFVKHLRGKRVEPQVRFDLPWRDMFVIEHYD